MPMPIPDRTAFGTTATLNLAAGVAGAAVNLVIAATITRHLGAAAAGTYFLVVAAFMYRM